jgi:hypothetical protein
MIDSKISCLTGNRNLMIKLKKNDKINKEKKTFHQLESLLSLDLKIKKE